MCKKKKKPKWLCFIWGCSKSDYIWAEVCKFFSRLGPTPANFPEPEVPHSAFGPLWSIWSSSWLLLTDSIGNFHRFFSLYDNFHHILYNQDSGTSGHSVGMQFMRSSKADPLYPHPDLWSPRDASDSIYVAPFVLIVNLELRRGHR